MAYKQQLISPSWKLESLRSALADSVSGEGLSSGSQMAVFLLCPHTVEGGEAALWGLFHVSINPIQETPSPQPSDLIASHGPYLLIPLHWRSGFNIWILGDINIQSKFGPFSLFMGILLPVMETLSILLKLRLRVPWVGEHLQSAFTWYASRFSHFSNFLEIPFLSEYLLCFPLPNEQLPLSTHSSSSLPQPFLLLHDTLINCHQLITGLGFPCVPTNSQGR